MPTFNGIEDNCINGLGYAVYEVAPRIKTKPSNLRSGLQALKLQGESGSVISARFDAQDLFAKHILSIIWKLTPTTLILHIRCLSA